MSIKNDLKRVLIIANYVSGLETVGNSRFLYLANLLVGKSYNEVELITSSFSHSQKKQKPETSNRFSFKVSLIYEPGYKKNICLRRFYSHFVWGRNLLKHLKANPKPDVVYCAIPSLTGPRLVSKYCKKHSIPFIIDVQDLWPEAFRMVFNPPVISTLIYSPFMYIANSIYKNANIVCAVSQTYVDRAQIGENKRDAGHSVFLGTDLAQFDDNVAKNHSLIKKGKNEIWLGYCGTLGASYDLSCVFEALQILKAEGCNPPKFVIMGDGPLKGQFENEAKEKDVDVWFMGRLPYDHMCTFLSACDITVNPIRGKSAASIINKHADYAACGLPTINTQESKEYQELIDTYKMGFNCKNGDARDVADKIKLLMEVEQLRIQMGKNGRRCAEELFDRKATYPELIEVIMDNMDNKK